MSGPFAQALATIVLIGAAFAQSPTVSALAVPDHPRSRYFLCERPTGDAPPANGRGLLVVLPGDDDDEGTLEWVNDELLTATPADFLVAMVARVPWTDDQQIAWPTRRFPVLDMAYPTEDYVAAVVADVAARHQLDPSRVLLLAWSASGPAAYEIAVQEQTAFAGFYIAMSMFRPYADALPHAAGRRFALDQSPDDEIAPLRFAQHARDELTQHGGIVWLRRYAGGHGWQDEPLTRIRDGLSWLVSDAPAPRPLDPGPIERGPLQNGGFEFGIAHWSVHDVSNRLRAEIVEEDPQEGSKVLRLTKTGGSAIDQLRQEIELPDAPRVRVTARVRWQMVMDGFVKFTLRDAGDSVINDAAVMAQLQGEHAWRTVARTFAVPAEAAYAVISFELVGAGTVWVDDVRIEGVR